MNHNFSFILLITALLLIASCSSPQQKPTNTVPPALPPADISLTPATTTKASKNILIPTPYVPKPTQPKITQVNKTTYKAKPAPKKAPPATKAQPSKPTSSTKIKPIIAKTKLPSTKPATAKPKRTLSETKLPTPKATKKPTIETSTQPSPLTTTPPETKISLESLPLKIGSWTLSESQTLSKQCSLVSTTNKMHDGQGETPVYLEITQQHIIFRTKSNIDTSYTGTGAFIGQQKVASVEQLHTPTSVQFDKDFKPLINAMKKHTSLEIKVGFWPSWPITQAYATTFKTDGFETAYNALKKCDLML